MLVERPSGSVTVTTIDVVGGSDGGAAGIKIVTLLTPSTTAVRAACTAVTAVPAAVNAVATGMPMLESVATTLRVDPLVAAIVIVPSPAGFDANGRSVAKLTRVPAEPDPRVTAVSSGFDGGCTRTRTVAEGAESADQIPSS